MPSASSWRDYPQTYRLEAARCTGCGETFFPPRRICTGCRGRAFETIQLGRTGKVLTWTVIRTPDDRWQGEAPFAVGIVELEEGPRVTVQIVDLELEELRIGLPVRLEFRRQYAEGHAGIIEYGHKAVPIRT